MNIRCLEALGKLTIVLILFIGVCATGSELEEQWNRSIPEVCWSLSVSDDGTVAALEVGGSETVLGVYSVNGAVIKRWAPPRGKQFKYSAIDGIYVVAQYGYSDGAVVLFGDEGREQLWAKSAEDMWSTSVSLSAASGRVTFADYPMPEKSTVWCYTVAGEMVWKNTVPSLVTDTCISASGNVVVAGEKYGMMYDEGIHAVYLFSPTGQELWRVEAESPVIDVAITPQAEYVVAGFDDGGMAFLDKRGRILWSKGDVGAWIDMSADANVIVASTVSEGIVALDSSGEILWRSSDWRLWGDRDGLCVSDNGDIVVALRFEMIYEDNVVQVLSSMGEVLYEQEDATTAPRVAVSPSGRYVAIAFGRRLRLFKAGE